MMSQNLTERNRALRKTNLFSMMDEDTLNFLVSRSELVTLESGELLFAAGDECEGLFIVVSGKTRAYRHGVDGREQTMHEDVNGATFPEVAVFDDGPNPSTVVALEPSTLMFLRKSDVRKLCLKHPEVALAALRVLAGRLRRAAGMVEDLSLRDVGQRLAEYLIEESSNRSPGSENCTAFDLVHTNQEIADLIGSVREVVSRCFSRLQQKGMVKKRGRRVELLNLDALNDYIEGL